MSSEQDYQPPRRATDPHAFPTTSQDWHTYRRWLARHGRDLRELMQKAPTLAERDAARREWEAIADLTGNAERAYRLFQDTEDDAAYGEHVMRIANRIWTDWASPESSRPPRDPSRHAVASLAYDDVPVDGDAGGDIARDDTGAGAGSPVGLDTEGRRLSAAMHKLDTPGGEGRTMRLPRANVVALTEVLEEFAARLMLARASGELTEGDDYIRAVVELQADLESRRFDG